MPEGKPSSTKSPMPISTATSQEGSLPFRYRTVRLSAECFVHLRGKRLRTKGKEVSPPWRRHLGRFRSVTARPGGVLFGHVFALRARPGGVAWAAFALLRPPLWREWAAFPFCLSAPAREAHLGSCFIPGPALEAPLGHCTRVGTPKEGKLSLMTLTSNVKRELRLPQPRQGHSRTHPTGPSRYPL